MKVVVTAYMDWVTGFNNPWWELIIDLVLGEKKGLLSPFSLYVFLASLKRVLSFTPLLLICDYLFCYFYILAETTRSSKMRMIRALYL